MRRAAASCTLLLAAACGRSGTPDGAAETARTDTAVAEVGAAAARQLRESLVQRLTTAIERDGPARAIDVCAQIALPLTDSVADAIGPDVTVRRTSLRVRNPRNAPDSLELLALEHFTTALATTGELPRHYIQHVDDDEYRYYEPLGIMPLCVQCHGPVDAMRPDVRSAIAQRYPADRATGYEVGDLRGVIRISVPPDRVNPR